MNKAINKDLYNKPNVCPGCDKFLRNGWDLCSACSEKESIKKRIIAIHKTPEVMALITAVKNEKADCPVKTYTNCKDCTNPVCKALKNLLLI